jgi:DNA-binding transcriptional LysR family regulator
METNRIRQFMVLVETKHLRKAADLMHTSHGAFHKSMQVLQEELGQSLYTLEGRSIVITPEGHAFYERAKEFIEAEKRLIARNKNTEISFRIGSNETLSSFLVAPYWKKYFDTLPLLCRELLPGRLEEAVNAGVIDVGLTYEPSPLDGLDFISIGKVEMGIYGRKGRFPSDDKLPFVAPVRPLETIPSGARGLDGWPETTVPRYVSYRVDSLSTAMAFVEQGMCVIFIPHFVARVYNERYRSDRQVVLYTRPKALRKVTRDIYMVRIKGATESKEYRNLAKMIRNEAIHYA